MFAPPTAIYTHAPALSNTHSLLSLSFSKNLSLQHIKTQYELLNNKISSWTQTQMVNNIQNVKVTHEFLKIRYLSLSFIQITLISSVKNSRLKFFKR